MENKTIIFGSIVIVFILVVLIIVGANSEIFKNDSNIILNDNSQNYKINKLEPSLISQQNKSKQAINFTWNIQKSGAEENLDVTFDIINSTNTEFCIGFENKTSYVDYYEKENDKIKDKEKDKDKIKDLKKVPITKIKDDKNKLKIKADLDLDTLDKNSRDCFIVEHEENPKNVSFKIGWNSVTISTNGESASLSDINSNMVRLDSGRLVTVFENSLDDISCAQSDDNGESWTVVDGAFDITSDVSIVTNGTRIFIVDRDNTPDDLQYAVSDNGCPSAGFAVTDFTDLQNVEGYPYDIKYDGINNQYVLCYLSGGSQNWLYFANMSETLTNSWTSTLVGGTGTSGRGCAISVDEYGTSHIALIDSTGSKLEYYSSDDNFITTLQSQELDTNSFLEVDISTKGSSVFVTATKAGDLISYYSGNNGTDFYTWDNLTSVGTLTNMGSCLDENLVGHIVIEDTSGTDNIKYIKFVNGSGNEVIGTIESSANNYRYPRLLCGNYPANLLRDGYLEYVFEDISSNNILFGNYFIGEPLSTHNSAILTSSLGTNLTTENLTLSLSGASGGEGSVIHNITDWRVNDSSIAVLNVPFFLEESPITDFSTNQFSGVISGNPTFNSSGQVGGAYDFDGTGDYINFSDGTVFNEFNGEFSVETWVNIDNFAVSGQNYIFSTCNIFNIGGFCLQVGDDHNYKFTVTNSSVFVRSLNSPAIQDSWQHVVGTYNGTDIKLYVNGSLVNSSYYPSVSGNSNNGYAIIGADYLGNQYFDGQISSLKVYNRSLSDEQIAYNYQRGLSGLAIDKIMSQETEVGQNWTANVTTTDLIDYGGSILSNPLLIVAEAGADTCTYTSGNWQIDCSDNCVISSNVNLGGNNISIIGTGIFTIQNSNISNFRDILIKGADSSNLCEVNCIGGCFEY